MPEDQRPNIILIMVDDADRKVLEHQASARIRAAIADHGATATRFLHSQPLCGPSRASILTGRYPHNTGVDGNKNAYANLIANGGETTNVATRLHDAGYRTALVGKYINHYPDQSGHGSKWVPPGWDFWFGLFGTAYDSYNYKANYNGKILTYRSREQDYVTDVLRGRALEFLASPLAQDPFLMVVTPMSPHSPSIPAERHERLYWGESYPTGAANPSFNEDDVSDKPFYVSKLDPLNATQEANIDRKYRRKLQCMESVADLVEAIVDALDDDDERLARTYIFFTSDNGFHMGEHRLGNDVRQDETYVPTPGGKNTLYEEDIRVPLWVRGPGIAAGSTVPDLIGNVDLAPTFCAIGGASYDDGGIDGRNALPVLQGESAPWRTEFLIGRGGSGSFAGLRSADEWIFAELDAPQPLEPNGEYYDLDPVGGDPYELDNAYLALQADDLGALRARVAAYRVCAGDSCRTADTG